MEEKYLMEALKEAKKGYLKNEVPVGAVIVYNNKIIARAHNKKITTNNVYGHAEMIAIQKASKKLGDWRLNNCIMYVTLEPCPMCASAIQQSRIDSIYIGAESNLKVNKKLISLIFQNKEFCHQVIVHYVKNIECSNILTQFFAQKRG